MGRRRRLDLDRASLLFVFLVLPFALYAVMVLWPFVQAVTYSLTSWSGFSPDKPFIGLDNYTELLDDATFLKAVRNSLTLLLVLPVVTLGIAFAFAVLVTVGGPSAGGVRGVRGSAFYRVISFFPYVIPAIVVGLIWAQVYDPNNGLLNGVLTRAGGEGFEAFAWLGEKSTAMGATILVAVWGMVGFYMVLFISAIQGIDREVLEAARLDGAGASGSPARSSRPTWPATSRPPTSTSASSPWTASSTCRRSTPPGGRTTRPGDHPADLHHRFRQG